VPVDFSLFSGQVMHAAAGVQGTLKRP